MGFGIGKVTSIGIGFVVGEDNTNHKSKPKPKHVTLPIPIPIPKPKTLLTITRFPEIYRYSYYSLNLFH